MSVPLNFHSRACGCFTLTRELYSVLFRDCVTALFLAGKPQVAIVRALHNLNVNKSLVSRTIARYRDISSVASYPKIGQKKNGKKPEMIRKVKVCRDLIEIHATVVKKLLVS